MFEESETIGNGESIAHETSQIDERPNATFPTTLVKEEESLQDEDKNTNPTEASPEHKSEDDGSCIKAVEDIDSNPRLTEANENSKKETSKDEEGLEQELQKKEQGELLEESPNVMAEESEVSILSEKVDDITSLKEVGAVRNVEETVEQEKKAGTEDNDVIKVKKITMEEVMIEKIFQHNWYFLFISITKVTYYLSAKARLITSYLIHDAGSQTSCGSM